MSKVGRKGELSLRPDLVGEICGLFERGATVRTVCECTGISQSSFFRWLRDADEDEELLQFREAVMRARGRGKVRLLDIAWKHAERDPRTALELLRLISPSEFGRDRGSASATPSMRADSGVVSELIRREQARPEPDNDLLQSLTLTLEAIREDNKKFFELVASLDCAPPDEMIYTLPASSS